VTNELAEAEGCMVGLLWSVLLWAAIIWLTIRLIDVFDA
jgi:hypothetical protein